LWTLVFSTDDHQGQLLPESPQIIPFTTNLPYSLIRPPTLSTTIYVDVRSSSPPPLLRDAKTRRLCCLAAPLASSPPPPAELPRRIGLDGKWYYSNVAFSLEVSAREDLTAFSLMYKGESRPLLFFILFIFTDLDTGKKCQTATLEKK